MRHVGDRSDCGVDDDGDRAAAVAWLARDPLALRRRAGDTIRDAADTFPSARALGRCQGGVQAMPWTQPSDAAREDQTRWLFLLLYIVAS